MKFFIGILLVALVALANAAPSAEEAKQELNPENVVPVNEATSGRNKRGFVYSTYTAPVAAAAVPVAATYTAAAPVAYAGVPYAYSAYSAYAPYYSGVPAVYY
ncbi:uncharacterized protein LOC131665797 [Phymastichus coffea]|uniref:uncharacterized protein LOC131665797 n=1 Tax=Phymastichus coffea TaxID=108790 RepID=UPI00273C7F6C|nr:uncharacterized protein LOC131665797 [Phymastichus coffea]